jgi:hypothetical protein
VAPLVPRFRLAEHPDVTLSLNLSDRVVDLAARALTAPCAWAICPIRRW